MHTNIPYERAQLQRSQQYVPSSAFTQIVGWKREGSGNILVKMNSDSGSSSAREPFISVVVGQISDQNLFVGPQGNYNPSYNKLATAKFKFILNCPDDVDFGPDFGPALKNIETVQNMINKGVRSQHFIGGENNDRGLRFSAPVFEVRVRKRTIYVGTPLINV